MVNATLGADPGNMDPHVGGTIFHSMVADHIWPALTAEDDLTSEIVPTLAESWETPNDTTYLFRLRKDVKFHDGKPFAAADVVFSFEWLLDKDGKIGTGAGFKQRLEAVQSTEIVDEHTVKVTLKAPLAVFAHGLSTVRIVPRDFDVRKPVGAGPFEFVEWSRNQHVKLKRFDGYFQKGLPYLDELNFFPTPDENAKITRLQTGQVNFTDTIPFPRIDEVKKLPGFKIFQMDPAYAPSHYPLLFNVRRPPFDKVEVRQALSHALDRQAIKDATFGFDEIMSSAVPKKHWAFNPAAPSYDKTDVARAKELLGKVGLSSGFKAQMKFVTSRAEYTPIAELMQASWSKIGVQVEILPREVGVWLEEVYNKSDYDMGLVGFLPAWDPHFLLTSTYVASVQKSTGWANEEFDRLM